MSGKITGKRTPAGGWLIDQGDIALSCGSPRRDPEIVEVEIIEAVEIARLRRELAEDREAIRRIVAVLPDNDSGDNESWGYCWDALNDEAQEAVKEARNLPAVRRAVGGA